MPINEDYLLYHNPTTMGREFKDIASTGIVATNKVGTADKAMENRGVIWCVGRRDKGKNKHYFLYQRIVEPIAYANKEDDGFKVILKGQVTFRTDFEREISSESYFPQIKKLLSLGLQRLTDVDVLKAFREIYEEGRR
ncbi:hypothetical protein ACFSR9_12110 [Deinococcus taklimakanensis]|uniref:Uncharacterized protein n=1 Tax=Deinococcus taklimakanensis TaxID=536443 RepID=A0ABW5P7F9_9DEIO